MPCALVDRGTKGFRTRRLWDMSAVYRSIEESCLTCAPTSVIGKCAIRLTTGLSEISEKVIRWEASRFRQAAGSTPFKFQFAHIYRQARHGPPATRNMPGYAMQSLRLSPAHLKRYLPVLTWAKTYNRETASSDMLAAVIVTIMLIPQSLAYALLAGLPAEMGLYASILPLVGYAIFGTSRALAVGPVAVVSLMTAAAIGNLGLTDPGTIALAAITLAFLSGAFLMAMGFLRLGFIANFLSHPVIAGFITASGIIIAASQLKHILGIDAEGHNLLELVISLATHLGETNWITAIIGILATGFLFWVRKGLK